MADVGDFIRQRWPTLQLRINRLDDRKQVLSAQLAEIEAEQEEVNRELEAIKSAAKALGMDLNQFGIAEEGENIPLFRLYSFGDVSIKQAVRLALDVLSEGVNSHDLFTAINRRYFEDRLPRTSFSPQLSRLKQDGEVEDRGSGWVLTDKGRSIMSEGKILPYSNPVFD